jgi:hypothetical protein
MSAFGGSGHAFLLANPLREIFAKFSFSKCFEKARLRHPAADVIQVTDN